MCDSHSGDACLPTAVLCSLVFAYFTLYSIIKLYLRPFIDLTTFYIADTFTESGYVMEPAWITVMKTPAFSY